LKDFQKFEEINLISSSSGNFMFIFWKISDKDKNSHKSNNLSFIIKKQLSLLFLTKFLPNNLVELSFISSSINL
jgi:hypothetical protein